MRNVIIFGATLVALLSCALAEESQAQSQEQTADDDGDYYVVEELVPGTENQTGVVTSVVTYETVGNSSTSGGNGTVVEYEELPEDEYVVYYDYESVENPYADDDDPDVRDIETIVGVFADILRAEVGDPDVVYEEVPEETADAPVDNAASSEDDKNAVKTEGVRMRRGFNSSGYGTGGYGRGSDERDASVSQEGTGCSGNLGKGYGNSNSGSRELSFNNSRDSGSTERARGGRSFTRASASASSSASAYNGNYKANLVEMVKPKL